MAKTAAQEVVQIADVPLEIEVELDRVELKIGALLDLDVDSILEMPRSAGENLDIYIGGRLVGYGEIVIIENTMGLRITDFKSED
jgi:flagellar motor switch protein FliN/FliY